MWHFERGTTYEIYELITTILHKHFPHKLSFLNTLTVTMDTSAQFHKWKLRTHQQSANPYKKFSCTRGGLG